MRSPVQLTYRVTEQLDEAAIRAAVGLLSFEERARHGRFLHARDRRDFACAHALLRSALSRHAGTCDRSPHEWEFRPGPHGKPEILPEQAGDPPLAFSLSHTHGLVASVVARGSDLGVDVESIARAVDHTDVARRYFSAAENRSLDACPAGERAARFIELWTLKEAYVKALGEGLSFALDRFSVTLDGPIRIDQLPSPSPAYWTFALFAPTVHTRMALAVRSHVPLAEAIVAHAADGERLVPVRVSVEEGQ